MVLDATHARHTKNVQATSMRCDTQITHPLVCERTIGVKRELRDAEIGQQLV
jgi:hypothetical protein